MVSVRRSKGLVPEFLKKNSIREGQEASYKQTCMKPPAKLLCFSSSTEKDILQNGVLIWKQSVQESSSWAEKEIQTHKNTLQLMERKKNT